MPGCQCLRPVTIVGFRLLQARTAHVSPCTQTLVLLMKLYLLACLLAIASSAALESATKPTKKAAPKVDPVPLSTADTASEATHSRATHSHHHQDSAMSTYRVSRPVKLPMLSGTVPVNRLRPRSLHNKSRTQVKTKETHRQTTN